MIIRLAQSQDVPAIARIHVASWQRAYAGLLPAEVIADHSYAQRLALWEKRYVIDGVWVAEDPHKHQVMGFVAGGAQRHHPEYWRRFRHEIYGLYVDPQYQGQGVGRALLMKRRAQLGEVSLDCLASNEAALAFYMALGGHVETTAVYFAAGQKFLTSVLSFPKVE